MLFSAIEVEIVKIAIPVVCNAIVIAIVSVWLKRRIDYRFDRLQRRKNAQYEQWEECYDALKKLRSCVQMIKVSTTQENIDGLVQSVIVYKKTYEADAIFYLPARTECEKVFETFTKFQSTLRHIASNGLYSDHTALSCLNESIQSMIKAVDEAQAKINSVLDAI